MKSSTFFTVAVISLAGACSMGTQESKEAKAKGLTVFQSVDDSLTLVYNRVLKAYASQPEFIKQLERSQELWKEMREADMLMRFPMKDENPNFYGSAFSSCYETIITQYTSERIDFLNQWLEGMPEGEVCSGSIQFRKE